MMPFQHTRFGILRHSITEWNRCRRIQGQWDSPLTEDGKTLAMTWGHALKPVSWNRMLCSDLPRARKTAELINRTLDIPVMPDSRLRELDWGQWTGKTLEQLKMESSDLWKAMRRSEWEFCPPGGESYQNVWKRGQAALAEASGRWPGDTILVITHEGMIKSLVYHHTTLSDYTGAPPRLAAYHLHFLTFGNGKLSVQKLNGLDLSPREEGLTEQE